MKKNKLTPEEIIIVEETLAVLAEKDPEIINEVAAGLLLRVLGPMARIFAPSLRNIVKTHGREVAKELAGQAAQVAKEKGQAAAKQFFEQQIDALINKAKNKITPKEDEKKQPTSSGTASAQDAAKATSANNPPTNEGLSREKTIIVEEILKVLGESHCAGNRDTAIMPMGGPMASAIAPLPPVGSPIGGCGGGDPHVSKTHKEYDDAYMLKKSLEILANQALALHDAIAGGMILPSWAESKVYCAADDIKGVHANLDRGGVASGPQTPIIQMAESVIKEMIEIDPSYSPRMTNNKEKSYYEKSLEKTEDEMIEKDKKKAPQKAFEQKVKEILSTIKEKAGIDLNIQIKDDMTEQKKKLFIKGLRELQNTMGIVDTGKDTSVSGSEKTIADSGFSSLREAKKEETLTDCMKKTSFEAKVKCAIGKKTTTGDKKIGTKEEAEKYVAYVMRARGELKGENKD